MTLDLRSGRKLQHRRHNPILRWREGLLADLAVAMALVAASMMHQLDRVEFGLHHLASTKKGARRHPKCLKPKWR